MDHQRQRAGGGRRRKRKHRANEPRSTVEPILIAARRPNAPRVGRAPVAVSASPRPAPPPAVERREPERRPDPEPEKRRAARIVQVAKGDADDREKQRQRLLDRLMASETRGAITRSANEYLQAGYELPEEQPVQLQLLEHFDEDQARRAIAVLARLISHEVALKRPILEQRLRRLEEYAEEPATREAAAELRRAIRS